MERRQRESAPGEAEATAAEGEQASPVGKTLVEEEVGVDRVYKLDDVGAEAEGGKVQASDAETGSPAAIAAAPAPTPAKGSGKGATIALTQANTMPKTISVPAGKFGACQPGFSFANIEVLIPGDGSAAKVDATLKVECAWGVGDRPKNITGATDPQIDSAATARRIASDLEPRQTPDGRPTRETYWSKFWTQEHEWFHARDTFAWAADQGAALIRRQLATDYIVDKESAERALSRIATNLLTAWTVWFGADLEDEADKPGEQRCYAAFKDNYQALADSIRKRADELEGH